MFNWIKQFAAVDKLFCWSFIGVALATVVALPLTIYYGAYYQRKPKIALEILSDISIVNLKEDSKNLDILYDKASIKATGMNLRVMTIRVVNEGNDKLQKSDFLPESPFGFSIAKGEIIETPTIEKATNDYLSQNVKPSLSSKTTATFAPVLINENESYTIKAFILDSAPTSEQIQIVPIGELNGVRSRDVAVRRLYDSEPQASPFIQAVSGGFIVNVIRLCIALTLVILVFALIVFISIRIESRNRRIKAKRDREKRLALANKYMQEPTYTKCDIAESMLAAFVDNSHEMINIVMELTARQKPGQEKLTHLHSLDLAIVEEVSIDNKPKLALKDGVRETYRDFIGYLIGTGYRGIRTPNSVRTMGTKHGQSTRATSGDVREYNRNAPQPVPQPTAADEHDADEHDKYDTDEYDHIEPEVK